VPADVESAAEDAVEQEVESEGKAQVASAASAEQRIPPGKDPLPATAEEFAEAVLKRQKPN
jgi:hypothetical protein